jgi:hypothetical protein
MPATTLHNKRAPLCGALNSGQRHLAVLADGLDTVDDRRELGGPHAIPERVGTRVGEGGLGIRLAADLAKETARTWGRRQRMVFLHGRLQTLRVRSEVWERQ